MDVAAELENFSDFVTAEIKCTLNKDGLDTGFHTVVIQAPTASSNNTGRWRAFISAIDCRMFQTYGACILNLRVKQSGHALFMTRNDTTGTCEIYDPNGPFEYSFDRKTLQGFFQAVNTGLLRPLTSPVGNQTVFNVSLQSPVVGLQSFETHTERDVRNRMQSATSFAALELAFEASFWATDFVGFCMPWSILRFVDCLRQAHLIELLESAFLRNHGLLKLQFVAQNVLLEQFIKELPENGLNEDDITELFNSLLPCIFIRLFASYIVLFVKNKKSGLFIDGNVEDFLMTMKEAIARANDGNVILNAKNLWRESCTLDIAPNNGDQYAQFIFKRANGAVKEYVFSVDTTQELGEVLIRDK